jgi:hypothetical protein
MGFLFAEEVFQGAAGHVLRDDERLTSFRGRIVADVVNSDDVRVIAETAHSLSLSADACESGLVEALRLDECEGDVAVKLFVVGEVDSLACALAEKALDLVAAISEGCWQGR